MAITNRLITQLAQPPQLFFTVAIAVFYLFSLSAQIVSAENTTFEYFGIKSGMTRDEIKKHLNLADVAESKRGELSSLYGDKTNEEIIREILEEGLVTFYSAKFSSKAFSKLNFYFTDKETLWRLDVSFGKPEDPPRVIALESALKQRFKGHTMKEESSTSQYGTSHTYRIIMIDDNILNPAVQRYRDDYLKKM
jgi:hypothetical protein